ncbi:MAG: hypothetical protein HKM22_00405 [Gammaproteobacteria bacterium]|nr:hypothetical protein [Gammaproteobacteria bacterium]
MVPAAPGWCSCVVKINYFKKTGFNLFVVSQGFQPNFQKQDDLAQNLKQYISRTRNVSLSETEQEECIMNNSVNYGSFVELLISSDDDYEPYGLSEHPCMYDFADDEFNISADMPPYTRNSNQWLSE